MFGNRQLDCLHSYFYCSIHFVCAMLEVLLLRLPEAIRAFFSLLFFTTAPPSLRLAPVVGSAACTRSPCASWRTLKRREQRSRWRVQAPCSESGCYPRWCAAYALLCEDQNRTIAQLLSLQPHVNVNVASNSIISTHQTDVSVVNCSVAPRGQLDVNVASNNIISTHQADVNVVNCRVASPRGFPVPPFCPCGCTEGSSLEQTAGGHPS